MPRFRRVLGCAQRRPSSHRDRSASIALQRKPAKHADAGAISRLSQRVAASPARCTRTVARPGRQQPRQCPENRKALRRSVPPWGVLFDHRYNGRLVNVSRSGLAVELRHPPSFHSSRSLKVCWDRGDAVKLDVTVVWCRMIGVEQIEMDASSKGTEGDTVPRYLVGLECDDERLLQLGAARKVC